MKFYGFRFGEATAWKEFREEELEVLRDLNRPVKREKEEHGYETRGGKEVGDWIYSRL